MWWSRTIRPRLSLSCCLVYLTPPNWVQEDCSSATLDVYPVYKVSPDTTGYIPANTPVTPPSSEVLLPPPDPESLPLGALVSLNGVVACDITLVDHNTDLSLPLLPLPDGLLIVPVTASEQPSTSTERPSPREPLLHVASPPRDLSREGSFDAYCTQSDTGISPIDLRWAVGLPISHDSYASADIADVDPVYGLQLHHPRFLEFIGAPESARLLIQTPGHWLRTMDREDTVAVALQLQHDAGLMISKLQVLGQFVTSLNRMSSEVLRLAIRGHQRRWTLFLRCLVHTAPLITCLLWVCGSHRVARALPGYCLSHPAIITWTMRIIFRTSPVRNCHEHF